MADKFPYKPHATPYPEGKTLTPTISDKEIKNLKVNGRPISILNRINGGGEGDVFLVKGGDVCKLYRPGKLNERKVEKLKLMVQNPINIEGVCWPKAIVKNRHGQTVGYTMDYAEGVELIDFMLPKKRVKETLDGWNRVNLTRFTLKLLEKFRALHKKNIIFGDINEKNILVKNTDTIFFIDTDSFQFDRYPSEAMRPDYLPPEFIDNPSAQNKTRSFENEYFSIAVLIFKLLMLGKHPYDQVTREKEEINQSQRMKNGEFPYSLQRRITLQRVSKGYWYFLWNHYSFELKEFMIEVFHKDGKHFNIQNRASVNKWISKLERFFKVLDTHMSKQDPESLELYPSRDKDTTKSPYRNRSQNQDPHNHSQPLRQHSSHQKVSNQKANKPPEQKSRDFIETYVGNRNAIYGRLKILDMEKTKINRLLGNRLWVSLSCDFHLTLAKSFEKKGQVKLQVFIHKGASKQVETFMFDAKRSQKNFFVLFQVPEKLWNKERVFINLEMIFIPTMKKAKMEKLKKTSFTGSPVKLN